VGLTPDRIDIALVAAQAPVPWAVIDLDGSYVVGNDAFASLFGRTTAMMAGLHLSELTHERSRRTIDDRLAPLAQGELDRLEYDEQCRRADQTVFTGRVIVSLLRDDDGLPLALAGVIEDVTEHRAAMALLASNEDHLSAMRDRALALADQRASFVANVSHELRTPVHAVLGLTELLAERPLGSQDAELVAGIRREAERLRATVDDLLDYSRFEADGITLEIGPTDVQKLVDRVVQRAVATPYGARLAVTGRVETDAPAFVQADEHRLEQVLTNLVGNAAKFTAAGEVRLTVSSPRPGRLAFDVADTGPGIPHSHRELVFEPFVQVPGVTGATGGSGLGLALVRGLVELMGGAITLDCPPEGGSIFRVEVPCTTADAPVESPGSSAPRQNQGGVSVLVVEDNEVNQQLAREQLARLGHRATIVGTGSEALEILARPDHGHELVLMDWQLPDIDGVETTRRFRAGEHHRGARLPVIAMTASALPDDRAQCRAAGMDDFLPKPVSLRDLSAMIERWVPSDRPDLAETPEPADRDRVDVTALEALVSDLDDRAVVASLVTRYLDELDERGRTLQGAAAAGQLDLLHRVSHTLRSTSEMMGALELRDLCRELEAATPDSDIDSAVARFAGAADLVRSSLRSWLDDSTREAP